MAVAAVAAAVLLLGAAGTAWVRTRPPEQLTAVDVTVFDWVPDASGASGVVDIGNGVLQSSYRVTPGSSGDTVRILGLVGPGIRASKVIPHPSPSAEPATAVADVSVVLGCDDPALETPTAQDFRLRVEETDAYGRTTSGLAELPLTTSSQWVDYTVAAVHRSSRSASSSYPPASRSPARCRPARSRPAITVHNGLGHDVTLSAPQGQASAVYVAGGVVPLSVGADAVVPVTMR